jgi:hypothetical protein
LCRRPLFPASILTAAKFERQRVVKKRQPVSRKRAVSLFRVLALAFQQPEAVVRESCDDRRLRPIPVSSIRFDRNAEGSPVIAVLASISSTFFQFHSDNRNRQARFRDFTSGASSMPAEMAGIRIWFASRRGQRRPAGTKGSASIASCGTAFGADVAANVTGRHPAIRGSEPLANAPPAWGTSRQLRSPPSQLRRELKKSSKFGK